MQIKENTVLAPYTTFKIGGEARYFCVAETLGDLRNAAKFAREQSLKILILGSGSNVLVSEKGFEGLVISIDLKGVATNLSGNQVFLDVSAGEEWDSVVELAVKNGWWGIENLSHIPGKTGAVVVQNVGAYGQEAKDTVEMVMVYDLEEDKTIFYQNSGCRFGYRSSIFNSSSKGRYAILSVIFKLSKLPLPNLSYRDLQNRFKDQNPSLMEIRQAVIEIRDKKYPFPTEAKNGNAGSFFKNVILDKETYGCVEQVIRKNFGDEVLNKLRNKVFRENDNIKIPAAFLLDICGLKNIRVGGARINENQPLVIINATGEAMAKDVIELAATVRKTVFKKTGLKLSIEPELVGFSTEELKEIEN